MRIDFQRMEHLAQTTLNFVREQTKPLLSPVSRAVNAVFKYFIAQTGHNKQSIAGVLRTPSAESRPPSHSTNDDVSLLLEGLSRQAESLQNGGEIQMDSADFSKLKAAVQRAGQDEVCLVWKDIAINALADAPDAKEPSMAISLSLPTPAKKDEYHIKNLQLSVKVLTRPSSEDDISGALESDVLLNNNTSSPTQVAPETTNIETPFKLRPGQAFVDKQQASNLCGVAAINGYFQKPTITAGDVLTAMINPYFMVLNKNDINELSGLFHPDVVDAMKEGRNVTIGRDDFCRTTTVELHDFMYPLDKKELEAECGIAENEILLTRKNQARVAAQWRSCLNYAMPGDENKLNRDNCQKITLTPEAWIGYQGGMTLESLVNVTNRVLSEHKSSSDFEAYPNAVDHLEISGHQAPDQRRWLAKKLNGGTYKANHVICRSGNNSSGHYFALMKDAEGNWLKLDGLDANAKSGVRDIVGDNKINGNQLALKLQYWGVTQVIADEALTTAFNKYQF